MFFAGWDPIKNFLSSILWQRESFSGVAEQAEGLWQSTGTSWAG